MSERCSGDCIICGKCANAAILEGFNASGRLFTPQEGYGVAVDIGTTTVVLALMDLRDGKTLARHSFMNPQRAFGTDVISRIDAANKGHLNDLKQAVTDSVSEGLATLLTAKDLKPDQILAVTIGCNTVMAYLLLGFPCQRLGAAPYIPDSSMEETYLASELFANSGLFCPVRIIPWMAAYVGGDITAGLIYLLPQGSSRFLLIDLGTNGEMALYDNGRLTVTATAAGPAFEQPVTAGKFVGASAVVGALAELVRTGKVNKRGLLLSEEKGGPLTRKQVRELQLAKSAIRAGIEILIETSGLGYDGIDAIYLAGGMGQGMAVQDAADIGLIPGELVPKAIPVGNACLGGAAALLSAPAQVLSDMNELLTAASEVNLARHPNFNGYFMAYMFF
ncbi:MAG: ASKHA domain-containing protein [Oscillospiraceae bacterium]|nr:ASKHA domain-containing protein [Oscillospiraceae bacterium]